VCSRLLRSASDSVVSTACSRPIIVFAAFHEQLGGADGIRLQSLEARGKNLRRAGHSEAGQQGLGLAIPLLAHNRRRGFDRSTASLICGTSIHDDDLEADTEGSEPALHASHELSNALPVVRRWDDHRQLTATVIWDNVRQQLSSDGSGRSGAFRAG